jgi:hypothetical protein
MAYHISKIESNTEVADGKASLTQLNNLRDEIADISPDFYELEVAEVIQIYLDENTMPSAPDPFSDVKTIPEWSKFGCITARMSMSKKSDTATLLAYPLESNIKEYPLPGELVVVIEYAGRLFYTQKLNQFSSINSNTFSGFTATEDIPITNYTITSFLKNDSIREIKSQHGDITFNGRFGQSIRFGSNITPIWKDENEEPNIGTALPISPNILIRAGQADPNLGSLPEDEKWNLDDFPDRPVDEDLNSDGSSIWITTNQPTNLEFSGAPPKDYVHDELDKDEFKDIKKLGGNQIILNSDRISFNTKKNSVLINSTRNIALSAAYDIGLEVAPPHGKIKLGTMDANEPVLGGDQTMVLISDLCDIVDKFSTSLIAAVGGYITPVALTQLNTAAGGLSSALTTFKTRLDSAKSKTVFVGHLRG